jgi:hypothetical protein
MPAIGALPLRNSADPSAGTFSALRANCQSSATLPESAARGRAEAKRCC